MWPMASRMRGRGRRMFFIDPSSSTTSFSGSFLLAVGLGRGKGRCDELMIHDEQGSEGGKGVKKTRTEHKEHAVRVKFL